MSQTENGAAPPVSAEEMQRLWPDLTLRLQQLETEQGVLEGENKALRSLVERVIEHRQKSHGELVNMLTTLVSRLPLNDVGVVVARLVEHNVHVAEVCASLAKFKLEDDLLQPAILKALDKTKRDLLLALKPAVEELIRLDAPYEAGLLPSLLTNPEIFFTPAFNRANRGFVKGQVPRERIVREFSEESLIFFKDVTTDVKFNPTPKPEEIMLVFKPEFEELLPQHPVLIPEQRKELSALQQKIRRSREATDFARAQKNAFLRLSFILELLHYYDNQSTESPDVVFAQRLPPLIEQLVVTGAGDTLDEKLIRQAEDLLAFVLVADYRNSVINNIGKGGGLGRTLRFVLTFRTEKLTDIDPITVECVKHLIPQGKVPTPESLVQVLQLFSPHMQASVIRAIAVTDRLRKEDAQALSKALAQALGLQEIFARLNEKSTLTPEREQQLAWENIKNLIAGRAPPPEITAAIRKRLQAKYDADELKLCWSTMAETDALVFMRVFCLLPYLPDGQTDPIARAVLESLVTRLTHEKYAATYSKVLKALHNLFKVKADSPALLNFIALVKWVDPEAASRLAHDIGMPLSA